MKSKFFFKHRRVRVPTVLQMEATECGAASLGMVLAYFGRFIPLEQLRADCGVSRNGSKASLLVKAAHKHGLNADGYQVMTDDLDKLSRPLILFWEFNHFLVYEGHSLNRKYYYLNDPAIGPRIVDRELFEKSYTGVALAFQPGEHFQKCGKPLNVFRAMLPLLRDLKGITSAVIWGGLLMVIPGIAIPGLMQIFVDKILPGRSEWLVPVLLLFIVTMLLQCVISNLVALALRRGELQLAVNKTLEMLHYLFRLPIEFYLQRSPGDIQNRVFANASVANMAFGKLADNIVKFFTALFFLFIMFQFSAILSLVSTGFLLLDLLFFYFINRKRQVLNQSLLSINTKFLSNVLSGVEMIESLRAGGREDAVFLRWTGLMSELNRKKLHFQTALTYCNLLPSFFNALGNMLILCIGAWLVMRGELTLGGLFAFQTISASFSTPFTALLMSGSELQILKADLERINDVYKYKEEDKFRADDGKNFIPLEYTLLEMENVTFGYSPFEPPVLKDFSLKLCPGKRIAIVGVSGSGKTTVAKLANRTLTPWSGTIRLNGRDVANYTKEEFYHAVGTVSQNITLFSGTVGENLTLFAPRYENSELLLAVQDAAIAAELNARGPMLTQHVLENGANFSGGQRQRLEIARVLSHRTPLLILDEATSALDPVTEMEIDRAVRRRGCACLIVAHRLSTIRDCDEIILLNNGNTVERGTHHELMALNGEYAKLMNAEQGR